MYASKGRQRPRKGPGMSGGSTGPLKTKGNVGANYGFKRPPFVFSCLFLCFTVVRIVSAERQKAKGVASGGGRSGFAFVRTPVALLFLQLLLFPRASSPFFPPISLADPCRWFPFSLSFVSRLFSYPFVFLQYASCVVATDSRAESIGRPWTSGGRTAGPCETFRHYSLELQSLLVSGMRHFFLNCCEPGFCWEFSVGCTR